MSTNLGLGERRAKDAPLLEYNEEAAEHTRRRMESRGIWPYGQRHHDRSLVEFLGKANVEPARALKQTDKRDGNRH